MRDLFDEFLDELRRRQAEAAAANPEGAAPGGGAPSADDGARADEDASDGEAPDADSEKDAGAEPESDETKPDDREPAPDDEQGRDEHGHDEHERDADPGERRRAFEPVGGRGGGRRPPRPRLVVGGPNDGSSSGGRVRNFGLGFVGLAIVVVIILLGVGVSFLTDAIWFKSVGFESVFWTRVTTQVGLFAGGGILALVFLLFNIWLAGRLLPPPDPDRPSPFAGWFERLAGEDVNGGGRPGRPWENRPPNRPGGNRMGQRPSEGIVLSAEDLPDFAPIARWVLIALVILIALGVAGSAASHWETILLWRNQVPYGVNDPIFGRDISFYLFQLPFVRWLQSGANGLLLAALAVSAGRYMVGGLRGGITFTTQMRVHLAVLAGLYLASIAIGYQLDKLELVYSTNGVAAGVSFTDQNARFFAYDVLTVVAGLAGAFLVAGAFTRLLWPLGAVIIFWLSASVVLGQIYPAVIQRLSVEPDQLGKETTYIQNNIAMTRISYGLNSWTVSDYSGQDQLTQAAVTNEQGTFQNARLWDAAPLRDSLDQLQTVRQYYDFTNVDTDRYQINGVARQVMLAGRELAPEKNPLANSWVNQRITFTHGIGVAMVPVNAATSEGQPDLFIQGLPPVSSNGAPQVTQSRIYFGERPSDWIVVDARQDEFDYPVGSDSTSTVASNATTRWTGTTGIKLDTVFSRLLWALEYKDLNLLISDQITNQSQLLIHRTISDRISEIAPFLTFDSDPYLVINSAGGLDYIQDAYTTSDRFPNAQPVDTSQLASGSSLSGLDFNYIRNSVKVVVDAYTGQMTFYVNDPTDPIIETYEKVFPQMFTPISAMPADLKAHLRVPEDLFDAATRMYARYHVTDPAAFYNNEDLWTVPPNPGGSQNLPNVAYYVEMRLPDETAPEFLLLQPMVPASRPNMIAWIAARNDQANYGQVRVYKFPQDTSVLGPNQIAAKIDADPTISAQVTLWDQAGSHVIKGNLIVVPVQNSLIYLQPVYLQSANSAFPAFERIIVATPTQVVWDTNLAGALNQLLSGSPSGSPPPSGGPSPSPSSGPVASPSPGAGSSPPADNVAALVAYANQHFELAQTALRNGDFATYGAEIAKVQEALRELSQLVPSASSNP
ncbi:MAG TPA: UPF0182 family protein [Candidatus Limnocylindrales bacterium]